MNVKERARSLRQEQWFHHFRFELRPRDVPFAINPLMRPLAVARAGDVSVMLDSLQVYSKDGSDIPCIARIRTQNLERSRGSQREWVITEVKALDDVNSNYKISLEGQFFGGTYKRKDAQRSSGWMSTTEAIFWQVDGAPLRDNQRGTEIAIQRLQTSNEPKRLSLQIQVEAARHGQQVFDFKGMPLPKPGAIIETNRVIRDKSGGRLVLHSVGHYSQEIPLPGISPYPLDEARSGLVAVFEFQPAGSRPAKAKFNCFAANDNAGHSLMKGGAVGQTGDVLRPATPRQPDSRVDRWFTAFLLPPAPGATSFSVRMLVDEITFSGQRETVVFRDLPAPSLTKNNTIISDASSGANKS
jgi:hypothetical protein